MSVEFWVNNKAFANLLHNALCMAKEPLANAVHPYLYLRYTFDPDSRRGQLMAAGMSRFAAGLDCTLVEPGAQDGYAELMLRPVSPVKGGIVDDVAKLASGIRGVSSAASATVAVRIEHRDRITVSYGSDLVGELADLNPGIEPSKFYMVEDMVDELAAAAAPVTPTAFNITVLNRIKDLKITGMPGDWGVMDVAQHPNKDIVGVAVGPNFRGLLGVIDRAKYMQGGKWGDGPGNPDHLF